MSNITVGDRIRLIALPPYLKTAEPMPMLRSAEILQVGNQGVIIDRRPGGYWGVQFPQGAFLLESRYFEQLIRDNE
ncbi:MAG: regulatory protein SipA [Pleurocapsa sp.]